LYWRRAETALASQAGSPEEETSPSTPTEEQPVVTETPGPTPSSLPSPEEVYGVGSGAVTGAPQSPTERQGARTGSPSTHQDEIPASEEGSDVETPSVGARAVESNTHWGSRLGWNSRIDEIVSYFQNLSYLPPQQTPNQEGFTRAVRQYQSRFPRLVVDGIIGPNTWRQLRADMGGGAPQQSERQPEPARQGGDVRMPWSPGQFERRQLRLSS
jgi:peptidoglycan hydrolase-like protein with peptidoglycan-binding domain